MELKRKSKTRMIVLVASLLVLTTSLSYAFFAGGAGPAANTDVNVASGQTTKLTFTEGTPINLELNETTLAEGGNNVSGTTTSSATLTLGTNVANATDNYNVYFDITANAFVYTTATKTPEILLSITDPEGNAVTLTGLTAVSAGVYDITEYKGLIKVSEDYEISGSATTTQDWEAEITFVNLTTNQAANEGKSLTSSLILQSDIKLPQSSELILGHNGGKVAIEAKGEPNFAEAATTDEGMFATTDEYGTSYYYRGAIDNNWMLFNGIYWRIVRIAGNGSIKLLYSGTTAPTSSTATVMTGSGTEIGDYQFNSSYNNNAYVGYMYTLNERQGLTVGSPMKTTLESWYTTNMSGVDSQIADNTFCYDRSLAKAGYQSSDFGSANGSYTGDGLGTNATLYGTAARITASSSSLTAGGSGPELACSSKEDAYTVDDTTNGNGALSEKVGLLTADEAVMAGLAPGISNSSSYLYTNSYYWLGSPFGAFSTYIRARLWDVTSAGDLNISAVHYTDVGARPAVFLSNLISISGFGTYNDPYKVN